jgi:hypothetical protein
LSEFPGFRQNVKTPKHFPYSRESEITLCGHTWTAKSSERVGKFNIPSGKQTHSSGKYSSGKELQDQKYSLFAKSQKNINYITHSSGKTKFSKFENFQYSLFRLRSPVKMLTLQLTIIQRASQNLVTLQATHSSGKRKPQVWAKYSSG